MRIREMGALLESISSLSKGDRIASSPTAVGDSRQRVERVRENGLGVAYLCGANEGLVPPAIPWGTPPASKRRRR